MADVTQKLSQKGKNLVIFQFISVVLKELRRHRTRSALTISGVALSVCVLVSILGLGTGYRTSLIQSIDRLGYHVLVTSKGCPYEAATLLMQGGVIPMYMDEAIHREILRDADVAITTRLFLGSLPVHREGFSLVTGIENSFLEMKPWLTFQRGGWFGEGATDEVILGYSVAAYYRKNIGDDFPLKGLGQTFRVRGIFDRSGTQDDGTIFVPLGVAQRLFDKKEKITGIGVKLKDLSRIDGFSARVFEIPSVQVITMAQVQRTLLDLLGTARFFIGTVAIVAVAIAVLGVMNTMLIAVFERTREIGVMRAIGASRGDVFALICAEAFTICTIGGITGGGIAVLGSRMASEAVRAILPFVPAGVLVQIDGLLLIGGIAMAAGMGILAGIIPGWRASRLHPIEWMR